MTGKTFVEKILNATAGDIVFKEPDIVLTHDNTVSIKKTFSKMNGEKIAYPGRMLVVLDHNAPPTNAGLANDYQAIRDFVKEQGIKNFYDAGKGICHQIMAGHARPGQIIVGSDSHTCTAGAFNALAAGIDRTEAAGIWRTGETWFRVPESIKIVLKAKLREGVFAKDISLWMIGMLGSAGANYMSIEFHGEGVSTLNISERMTLANLASEMGAKNAVFPPDEILKSYFNEESFKGVWADPDASYEAVYEIDLGKIVPLVAVPHNVDHVKTVSEVEGTAVQQGFIGTCTNGRIEDLREAAAVLKGKKVAEGFQLLITPASQQIYLQSVEEGLVKTFVEAGGTILSSSCGPCLGSGQGIPADGINVISTANRNFKGRMGNPGANIYLASPVVVALSAINGHITRPVEDHKPVKYPYNREQSNTVEINENELRKSGHIWNYSDVDNLNTDQMFAGNLTYNILSSEGDAILPHLFEGFDKNFSKKVEKGDIIIAGENFGCGSSREHPAVGLAYAGVKAVIVKSVNRIFYRSAINQGLILIVNKEVVEKYKKGMAVEIDFQNSEIKMGGMIYQVPALPAKLMEIIENKGLINLLSK